ncbi:MAG: hypothetical protein M1839_004532 [Geoglossum umbratile]|nr:MAG: hypothetical protein M1839_004532 [Geoglossum umbratile]
MAARGDDDPKSWEPRTLPEAIAVLAFLRRRVSEVEEQLAFLSKGNHDALAAREVPMEPQTPLEKPDWGGNLIYFPPDDHLPATEVGEEQVTSSPAPAGLIDTAIGQCSDSAPSPSEGGPGSMNGNGKPGTETNGSGESGASGSENGSSDANSRNRADRGTSTAEVGAGGPIGRVGMSRPTYPTPGVLRKGLSVPGRMVQGNYWYAQGDHLRRYVGFGIQFDPPFGLRQKHIRTVHIGNLPTGITLRTLMKSVRGGSVLRATLLDTTPITGTLSALVTFTHPRSAADYVAFANLYPISFMGVAAAIAIIDTPSFPMSPHIFRGLRAWNFTRVLGLNGVRFTRATLLRDLDLDLAARLNLIENIQIQNEFSVVLTFASIEMAVRTFATFGALQHCNGEGRFLPDPCAGSLGEFFKRQAESYGGPDGTLMDDVYDDTEPELDSDAPGGVYDKEMFGNEPRDRFLNISKPISITDEEMTEFSDDQSDDSSESPPEAMSEQLIDLTDDDQHVCVPCPEPQSRGYWL